MPRTPGTKAEKIRKEECVNHVGKRLTYHMTELQKLVIVQEISEETNVKDIPIVEDDVQMDEKEYLSTEASENTKENEIPINNYRKGSKCGLGHYSESRNTGGLRATPL